jgi:hypothetical protein
MGFGIFQDYVVFRVLQNHLQRELLNACQHFLTPVFRPAVKKQMARLISRWFEHNFMSFSFKWLFP